MTTQEKLRRILNDPFLFISSFMKIVDKRGRLVQFIPNKQQAALLKEMDKFNVVLKSRQLGITVLSCAYSLWLATTHPNTNCLLMAHTIKGGNDIFGKLKQLYNGLPQKIKQPLLVNNRQELQFANGSRISVVACGQKESVRGSTLQFVHVSEAAFCSDSIARQILAIEQCLTPNGKIIVESTANGFNYFSDMYFKAERGESLYKPFFFSWIDDKIMFADEYKQFATRYIGLHGSLPTKDELDKAELTLYYQGATIEQLVWRRLKIANSSEAQFAQEFPSCPTEAFISTGTNVFDTQKIHDRLTHISSTKTIAKPDDLPDVLKPWYNRGFSLWERPEKEIRYFVGVDCAEGLGGDADYSVVEVVDRDGYQIAEFRSNKIKAFEFTEIVNAIGRYFNTAFLVVEKASAGQTVCDRLYNDEQYHYPRMYKYRSWDAKGKSKRKVGFDTNKQSKQRIIDDFVERFEKDMLCINSEILLQEMKMFVYDDGTTKASSGHHDDTVMAMAMALFGAKEAPNYVN